MESKLKDQASVRGVRGQRVHLGVCPHCGGNVRRVRDIYGSYAQCIQCSREIYERPWLTAGEPATDVVVNPDERELMVA